MEAEHEIVESEIIGNTREELEDIDEDSVHGDETDGEDSVRGDETDGEDSLYDDEMRIPSHPINPWATLLNKPPRIGLSRLNRRIRSLHDVSVIVKSEE